MERWVACPDFEGFYEVSSEGRVRRVDSGKILKPASTYGYQHVMLTNGMSLRRQPRIHVLVCKAFHGPPPSPRHQAAHGDGNRSHNSEDNLRWATPEENAADRRLHGTHLQGEQIYGAVLTERDVPIIRRLLADSVPPPVLARAYGVTSETIRLVGHRQTWKHVPDTERRAA